MGIKKLKYKNLRELLNHELTKDEDLKTAQITKSLRHVRKNKVLTKEEFLRICRWKSPRAIHHYKQNSPSLIRKLTREAFTTRSEQRKIKCLTSLRGVSIPMASAILTLVNPKRYGVIDIRVWQLLFALESVRKNPKGINFTFKHWYHYLRKLRYHAKEYKVPVRAIERTLFICHKKFQEGNLY